MGKPYMTLQIFPCLIVPPVRDGCTHSCENLCPTLGVLKKISIEITKSGNSAHQHTPHKKNAKRLSFLISDLAAIPVYSVFAVLILRHYGSRLALGPCL